MPGFETLPAKVVREVNGRYGITFQVEEDTTARLRTWLEQKWSTGHGTQQAA